MFTPEQATEFSRRRNLSQVNTHHMNTKRTSEVQLTYGGQVVGSRLEVLKRGKVCDVTIFLPPMPQYP